MGLLWRMLAYLFSLYLLFAFYFSPAGPAVWWQMGILIYLLPSVAAMFFLGFGVRPRDAKPWKLYFWVFLICPVGIALGRLWLVLQGADLPPPSPALVIGALIYLLQSCAVYLVAFQSDRILGEPRPRGETAPLGAGDAAVGGVLMSWGILLAVWRGIEAFVGLYDPELVLGEALFYGWAAAFFILGLALLSKWRRARFALTIGCAAALLLNAGVFFFGREGFFGERFPFTAASRLPQAVFLYGSILFYLAVQKLRARIPGPAEPQKSA